MRGSCCTTTLSPGALPAEPASACRVITSMAQYPHCATRWQPQFWGRRADAERAACAEQANHRSSSATTKRPLEADRAERMLFLSGRAFVLFRRMKGMQGWSSPPKRFDAKPSAFPVRRLCYLCAAPGRPTPKIPFDQTTFGAADRGEYRQAGGLNPSERFGF